MNDFSPLRMLTLPDFKSEYRVGEAQTYDLIYSGQLIAVQVGSSTRIRRDDAERWVASLQPYKPSGASGRQRKEEAASSLVNDVDADPSMRELLLSDVSRLNLGARAMHYVIHESGIRTIADLVRFSEYEILKLPRVSRITLSEIRAKLAIHKLRLGMKVSDSLCEEVAA